MAETKKAPVATEFNPDEYFRRTAVVDPPKTPAVVARAPGFIRKIWNFLAKIGRAAINLLDRLTGYIAYEVRTPPEAQLLKPASKQEKEPLPEDKEAAAKIIEQRQKDAAAFEKLFGREAVEKQAKDFEQFLKKNITQYDSHIKNVSVSAVDRGDRTLLHVTCKGDKSWAGEYDIDPSMRGFVASPRTTNGHIFGDAYMEFTNNLYTDKEKAFIEHYQINEANRFCRDLIDNNIKARGIISKGTAFYLNNTYYALESFVFGKSVTLAPMALQSFGNSNSEKFSKLHFNKSNVQSLEFVNAIKRTNEKGRVASHDFYQQQIKDAAPYALMRELKSVLPEEIVKKYSIANISEKHGDFTLTYNTGDSIKKYTFRDGELIRGNKDCHSNIAEAVMGAYFNKTLNTPIISTEDITNIAEGSHFEFKRRGLAIEGDVEINDSDESKNYVVKVTAPSYDGTGPSYSYTYDIKADEMSNAELAAEISKRAGWIASEQLDRIKQAYTPTENKEESIHNDILDEKEEERTEERADEAKEDITFEDLVNAESEMAESVITTQDTPEL